MDDGLCFSVSQKHGITKLVNNSKFTLIVSILPIKPKRKYTKAIIVPPHSFKIYDCSSMGDELDLTTLSFGLEKS